MQINMLPTRPADGDRGPYNCQARNNADHAARMSARVLRDAERAIAELRPLLAARERMQRPWSRVCWVCGAPALCDHREPELMDLWRQSAEAR
jgi:hypothetical protein